jgi:hypothetical protein
MHHEGILWPTVQAENFIIIDNSLQVKAFDFAASFSGRDRDSAERSRQERYQMISVREMLEEVGFGTAIYDVLVKNHYLPL